MREVTVSIGSKRKDIYNFGGLNLRLNPFLQKEGEFIKCVNYDKDFIGGIKKRKGYTRFLDNFNDSTATNLFSWTKNDGTSTYVYGNFGGNLGYYNVNGTANTWKETTLGTATSFLNDTYCGHAVVNNTLFINQSGGSLMYTTNGTSFATAGTLAPSGVDMCEYNQSLYVAGTANTLFKSVTGDGTNWSTSGTSDSTSIDIPGDGKISRIFTCNDKLTITKTSGEMYTYDEYSLRKVPTNQGIKSPYSLAELEDYWFYLNNIGIRGFNGNRPQLLSNIIQREIFNDNGTGITGTNLASAAGIMYYYNYLVSVGDITDDITYETITNCIIKYDTQLNEFTNYSFPYVKPVAWTNYKDSNLNIKTIFAGNINSQCFTLNSGYTDHDGSNEYPIQAIAEFVLHFNAPSYWKYFDMIWVFASPGCQAKVQIAIADTFARRSLNWVDIGDLKDGFVRYKVNPPTKSRGKLLFVRFIDNNSNATYQIYGMTIQYDILPSA